MTPQLLYLFDPLCGWCFGFSEVIYQFSLKHNDKYEFVPIPGGMVTGDRIKPYSHLEAYVTGIYKRIEELSGRKFGSSYIDGMIKSETITDSEPPGRALITYRSFNANRSMEFAKSLLDEHFIKGRDYNQEALYAELAERFGIQGRAFMDRYNEIKMKQQVRMEFAWVRESGVQGYPTVVLRKADKYYLLSSGFVRMDQLDDALAKALKMLG